MGRMIYSPRAAHNLDLTQRLISESKLESLETFEDAMVGARCQGLSDAGGRPEESWVEEPLW